MKANELKIGGIVQYEGTVLTIEEVGYDLCSGIDKDGVWLGTIYCERITPIPLTEEVLEKNGWLKGHWCFVKDFLTLVQHENKAKGFSFSVYGGKSRYNIKNIHELQHLLWALGMDDDLKI